MWRQLLGYDAKSRSNDSKDRSAGRRHNLRPLLSKDTVNGGQASANCASEKGSDPEHTQNPHSAAPVDQTPN